MNAPDHEPPGRYANRPVVDDKLPVPLRAGSRLTDAKYPIFGPGRRLGSTRRHGMFDPVLAVYQGGGEWDNFTYRRLNVVSLAIDVWEQIAQRALTVEMIDHKHDCCYTLSTRAMRRARGQRYADGIGPRIGWHVDQWRITDREGRVLQLGTGNYDPTHPGDLGVQLSLWEVQP